MSLETANFLHTVSGGKTWDHALLLTYDFEPRPFFELDLLPLLRVKRGLTVACDSRCYRQIFDADPLRSARSRPVFAGRSYNIESVEVARGGAFHAKLFLLLSDAELLLALGSANITSAGFRTNAELMQTVRLSREDMEGAEAQVFLSDLRGLLSQGLGIAGDSVVSPTSGLRAAVEDILATSWFEGLPDEPSESGGVPRLLHTGQRALVEQMLALTDGAPHVTEVLAPFYDDREFLSELNARCGNLILYVPLKGSTFPQAELQADPPAWLATGSIVGVSAEEDDRERTVHAKMYRLTVHGTGYRFVTSANCTRAGLGIGRAVSNFEVALACSETTGEAFLAGGPFTTAPADVASLTVASDREKLIRTDDSDSALTGLRGAFLDGQSIRLDLSPSFVACHDPTSFVLRADPGGLRLGVRREGEQFSARLHVAPAGEAVTLVRLQNRMDPRVQTTPCCLSRRDLAQSDLPLLSMSTYAECLRVGGKEGINLAIQRAQELGRDDWLFYLFSSWDLSSIFWAAEEGEQAEETGDDLPHMPTHGIVGTGGAPDMDNLRRNLEIYHCEDEFLRRLSEYLGEFRERLEDVDGLLPHLVADIIDATVPLCLLAVQTFQKQLERQRALKGKGWPHYRRLHILHKLGYVVVEVSKFLKTIGRYLAKPADDEDGWWVELKCWLAFDLWRRVQEEDVFEELRNDSALAVRSFEPTRPAEDVVTDFVCERTTEVSDRQATIFGAFDVCGIECPYRSLLGNQDAQ